MEWGGENLYLSVLLHSTFISEISQYSESLMHTLVC